MLQNRTEISLRKKNVLIDVIKAHPTIKDKGYDIKSNNKKNAWKSIHNEFKFISNSSFSMSRTVER